MPLSPEEFISEIEQIESDEELDDVRPLRAENDEKEKAKKKLLR